MLRMDKAAIISTLKANEASLRARGVLHAALFGSRARGDYRPDSDIDIMIELAPDTVEDVYSYVNLKSYVAALFNEPVDVVSKNFLKPTVHPLAEADALYAF